VVGLIVIGSALGLALVIALVYDWRDRRHGAAQRRGGDMLGEAVHHRVDIDAVPYEPARHAGQRDWATYRQRDRKRGGS
jgi:hypothetical protein